MNKKRFWVLLASFFAICAPVFFDSSAAADTILNVSLVRFEAILTETGVRLEWDVETEVGTAGYKIKRGESGVFDYIPDPEGNGALFVLANGSPTQAFSYGVTDDSAVTGATYIYQLVEVTTDSNEQVVDEVTVSFIITPTNTPVFFSGDTGDPGSNNPGSPATATTAASTSTSVPPAISTSAPPPTVVAPTPLPTATAEPAQQSTSVARATAPPPATSSTDASYPASEQVADVAENIEENIVRSSLVEVPVAEAQELDESQAGEAYPAPEVQAEMADNAIETNTIQSAEPVQIAAQPDNTAPVEIGGRPNDKALVEESTAEAQETQEPENQTSSRILLWIAFFVALIIFSGSVIGAILLYSRRRPMK